MKKSILTVARHVYAALCCIYAFSIGFIISSRARGAIAAVAGHFGFRIAETVIPSIGLSEITDNDSSIHLTEIVEKDGNITLFELAVIVGLIKRHRPASIFEIGTFDGRTTANMAVNSLPQAKIYTLDLPKEQLASTRLHITSGDRVFIDKEISGSRFAGKEYAEKITQLYGDSAAFDFSPYYNLIDFVFLDGSHAHGYVLNDSRIALRLLRNGHGTIVWHDYGAWRGVTRALNEFYANQDKFKQMRHVKGSTVVYLLQ